MLKLPNKCCLIIDLTICKHIEVKFELVYSTFHAKKMHFKMPSVRWWPFLSPASMNYQLILVLIFQVELLYHISDNADNNEQRVLTMNYAHGLGFCCVVLCFGICWYYPHPSGFLHWYCRNHTPAPAKQPWASIHQVDGRLTAKSREVSKPRDCML